MSVECFEMSLDQFSSQAILITVTPVMTDGRLRLVPSSQEAESAVEVLRSELARVGESIAVQAGMKPSNWASKKVDELLSNSFSDELLYSRIPNGRPVILVKDRPAQLHGTQEVLRRTHLNEVTDAVMRGQRIPDEVFEEYASELSDIIAQRSLPVS
jgi:hypothetical protein